MTEAPAVPDAEEGPPATPRWAKMLGAVLVVILLLVAVVVVVSDGEHGPGRHAPMTEDPDERRKVPDMLEQVSLPGPNGVRPSS